MEFTFGSIMGILKKAPLLYRKANISVDVSTSINEIIYIIKNNGNKNIKNFIMSEYKDEGVLEFPDPLFDDFEKRYFFERDDKKLFPIDFRHKFRISRSFLSNELNFKPSPSIAINAYCNFFESNISLLLNYAVICINLYYKYLEPTEEDDCLGNQQKEIIRIKKYLINLIEITNFIHEFSKNISLNHNLHTLKKIFNTQHKKNKLIELIIFNKNFNREEFFFIKNLFEKSQNELDVKPNELLYFKQKEIMKNNYFIIKKPIFDSMVFDIKINNEHNIIIKDYAKKIEIKYEEFSICKTLTKLINSDYRNNNACIKKLSWNKIEVIKTVELNEIRENSSNIYDKHYR